MRRREAEADLLHNVFSGSFDQGARREEHCKSDVERSKLDSSTPLLDHCEMEENVGSLKRP